MISTSYTLVIVTIFATAILLGVLAVDATSPQWYIDHCPTTPLEKAPLKVNSFQIWIRLRNLDRLEDSASYEPTNGDKKEEQEDILVRRLKKATSIFSPSRVDFEQVEAELNQRVSVINKKNFVSEFCTRKTDSIVCRNVPVLIAESIFQSEETNFKLCFHKHAQHKNLRRLLSPVQPKFLLKSKLVDQITGLSPYTIPDRGDKMKKSSETQATTLTSSPPSSMQSFPTGATSSPVILKIQKIRIIDDNDGSQTFKFESLDLAMNCLDGSPTRYDATTSTLSCFNSSDDFLPQQISIRVHDEQGGNLVQPTYTIPSASVTCFPAGILYGEYVSADDQLIAVCRVSTSNDISGLPPWLRYSVSAIVTFLGGDASTGLDPMKNYFDGSYQTYPSANPPPGENHSRVTPLLTIPQYPKDIRNQYGVDDTEAVSFESPLVSQGVLEYAQLGSGASGYKQQDVIDFMKYLNEPHFDNLPIYYIGQDTFSSLSAGEAALDIEMLVGIARNAPTAFWSVSISAVDGDAGEFGSFVEAVANTFSGISSKAVTGFPSPYPSSWSISYGLSENAAVDEGEVASL